MKENNKIRIDRKRLFTILNKNSNTEIEKKWLEKKYRNYSEEYWNSRKLAPSSLLFYLGVNKKLKNIDHHTLFFDQDFKIHAKEIYEDPKWPSNPLFYLSCSSISDNTVAPEGMESLVFLISQLLIIFRFLFLLQK